MEEKYMSLITDYMDGTLTPQKEKEFRQYVKEGHIVMEEVAALIRMQEKITSADEPTPSENLQVNFYHMLADIQKTEAKKSQKGYWLAQLNQFFSSQLSGKVAFGALTLILGILIGSFLNNGKRYQAELSDLNTQMTEMQEMMMVSMLEKESVTERLKGVQMSGELTVTNEVVTNALFITLNNDESTNVRMAALNTLSQYADDDRIREGLINSITQQESPLMQVALAELMVALQEKKSIDQFKQLMDKEETPVEVKATLKESIELIM